MNTRSLWRHGESNLEQCERKFLSDGEMARRVWAAAAHHLRPEHGDREVAYARTTYFDTADLSYYRSCRGSVRRRLRVREYAAPTRPDEAPVLSDRCFLELKMSTGDRRSKTRLSLDPSEVPGQLAALTGAPLAPCVATWYRRRALVDEGGLLRVTLDDRLLLCRPQPIGSPFAELGAGEVLARGPAFVLEYKCCGAPPAWLLDALGELREATGFSKFVLGMNAVASAAPVPVSITAAAMR
jgi:hypothetical protein